MIHTKETLQVGAEFVKLALNLNHSTGVVTVQQMFRGWVSDRFQQETLLGTIDRVSVVMDHSQIYETDMDLSSVSCENDPFAISVSPDVVEFYMDPKNFPNDALTKFYMKHSNQLHMEEQNEYSHVHYGPQEMLPNGQKTGYIPIYVNNNQL